MITSEARRAMIVVMLAVALVILLASNAKAADKAIPDGWTCEAVKAEVARLGRVMAYAHAIAHGLTPFQIKEIRRRCKV